jgi:glycosyltransferase involved in cell wall biosynthesis
VPEIRGRILWKTATLSPAMASFRYRALYPSFALAQHGNLSVLTDRRDLDPGLLHDAAAMVIVKSFTPADIRLAEFAGNAGVRVFFDLCDNIFIPEYRRPEGPSPAETLAELRPYLTGLVVPTESLARVARESIGADLPVHVVPDCCETPALRTAAFDYLQSNALPRSPLTPASTLQPAPHDGILEHERAHGPLILWFGNHGSPWGSFGITDILIFREALERTARGQTARLVVVSNHRQKYTELIEPLRIPSTYLEWSPAVLERALRHAAVVIAPNSLDDFSRCKSSNRTLLALASGVPVVATMTPALDPIKEAVWTHDPAVGIARYLGDRDLAERHVAIGRGIIEREYSPRATAAAWRHVLAADTHE